MLLAAETSLRAQALHSAAFLALGRGDAVRCAGSLGEESLALYREALGEPEGVGRTMHLLGQAAVELGGTISRSSTPTNRFGWRGNSGMSAG